MQEHGTIATVIMALKYIAMFCIPFVEPQLAGVLGGLAYIIVRHELKISVLCFKNILIVIFFGWMGAWATVNILAEHYTNIPHVWVHILSATAGFLSYDAMLVFGANSKSVVGFVMDVVKTLIMKWGTKWN